MSYPFDGGPVSGDDEYLQAIRLAYATLPMRPGIGSIYQQFPSPWYWLVVRLLQRGDWKKYLTQKELQADNVQVVEQYKDRTQHWSVSELAEK